MPCPMRVILVAISAALLLFTTYWRSPASLVHAPDGGAAAAACASDEDARRGSDRSKARRQPAPPSSPPPAAYRLVSPRWHLLGWCRRADARSSQMLLASTRSQARRAALLLLDMLSGRYLLRSLTGGSPAPAAAAVSSGVAAPVATAAVARGTLRARHGGR